MPTANYKGQKETVRKWNIVVSKKTDRETYPDATSMSKGNLLKRMISTTVPEHSSLSTEDAALRSEQEQR